MHPEEKLLQLLREMLPPESCERVLPPLLAICRGETMSSSRELVGAAPHLHSDFHPYESDPDHPYYWDTYYADD